MRVRFPPIEIELKNEFLILKCKPCIRIGEESDLKSDALSGVLGSNPRHGAIPADPAVVKKF